MFKVHTKHFKTLGVTNVADQDTNKNRKSFSCIFFFFVYKKLCHLVAKYKPGETSTPDTVRHINMHYYYSSPRRLTSLLMFECEITIFEAGGLSVQTWFSQLLHTTGVGVVVVPFALLFSEAPPVVLALAEDDLYEVVLPL